ncbi:hypothetical protein ACFP51_09660 [Streptomyces pratens]|uniref:ATP-binding protein n=1 Tax=Streptomyces pratens TaxID=887456 RepID=A0ABW1LYV6_9ACTN
MSSARRLLTLARIDLDDADDERRPPTAPTLAHSDSESGHGLLLVDILAMRWGRTPRDPVGRTVRAEVPTEPHQ